MRTTRVGEQRQAFQIQVVLADSFVRFTGAPRPKLDGALDLIEVIKPDGQAAFDRNQIDHVHHGVDPRQPFSSNHPPQQSFGRTSISCGILSERFVAAAGRQNCRSLENGPRIGEFDRAFFAAAKRFLQLPRGRSRFHFRFDAAERRACALFPQFRGDDHFLHACDSSR